MSSEQTPDHHAKRQERRRRVKRLRGRPLGDLNVLPSFLTEALAASGDVVQARAAELLPLLDVAQATTLDENDPADEPSPDVPEEHSSQ